MDTLLIQTGMLILLLMNMLLLIILLIINRKSGNAAVSRHLQDFNRQLQLFGGTLRDEFSRNRKESLEAGSTSRQELTNGMLSFQTAVNTKLDVLTKQTQDTLTRQQEATTSNFTQFSQAMNSQIASMNAQMNGQITALTKNTQDTLTTNLTTFMKALSERVDSLTKATQEALASQQLSVQQTLKTMQESNEKKLEEMRVTVDEKLQSTLEKRLTGSFQLVCSQLEAVQKGLGDMRTLANDVGGLKRALTNVKAAGGMGEIQLEALLNQLLSPEQFVKNAHPNPSNEKKVVEFAVKIPSKTADGEYVLLPIDSKYPATVWDKLTLAYESADKLAIEAQKKALIADIRSMARDIKEKYIEVPYTTDFGLMFLPFEGLFSEVMRIPGLFQMIQNDYKVTITGPTTLGAFLNSLQMGFRTLAIQKETSRIWELLGSVKTEFSKFGDVLAATKKKLESATNEIEKAETRTRVIERKLEKVEALPDGSQKELHVNREIF